MKRERGVWIVEACYRDPDWFKRFGWDPLSVHATRKDAKLCMRPRVADCRYRIRRYVPAAPRRRGKRS